jgi:hypothetical protein
MERNAGWQFMQDGILFAEFNHQGSERGGDEFVAPNWWMGGWRTMGSGAGSSRSPACSASRRRRSVKTVTARDFQVGEVPEWSAPDRSAASHDFFATCSGLARAARAGDGADVRRGALW